MPMLIDFSKVVNEKKMAPLKSAKSSYIILDYCNIIKILKLEFNSI